MGKSISLKPVAVSKTENQALKRRSLIEKVDAKFKGIGEPQVTFLNYRIDLITALNWYNVYFNNADKKKWTLSTITHKKIHAKLSRLDDSLFRSLGTLLRISANGNYLDTKELNFIDTKLDELLNLTIESKEHIILIEELKKRTSNQDKVYQEAVTFASQIDDELDAFIRTGYPRDFEFKSNPKSISGPAAKLIPKFYKFQIDELDEVLAGTCDQLSEGYRHVKQVQIKKWLKLLTDLASACTQQVVSIKKPRLMKPKAPGDVIKHLLYLIKFEELGLKSENPTKLVDCQEVWVYNTKYKSLSVYRAEKGGKLSINRTTITGFDVEKTSCRTIRKPEIVTGMTKMNKKELASTYNALTTKENKPNGRINDACIILKIFS